MLSFIKQKLQKIFTQVSAKLSGFWHQETIDEKTLHELELILLQADTGIHTTRAIIKTLKEKSHAGNLTNGHALRSALKHELVGLLSQSSDDAEMASIYLLVGINGSGKTTAASKLAYQSITQGKKTLLVAADTFRAAATEQLTVWAEKIGCSIVYGKQGQDPASVVFAGIKKFVDENFDTVIIDTAGRLQTKSHLMEELSKIKRVIHKHLPNRPLCTLLTIDAMLGQNSFEQAKLFHESTQLDGIILTKMDGTGKGGIIFSISHTFNIPVHYISFGESIEQLKKFNLHEYVDGLLG